MRDLPLVVRTAARFVFVCGAIPTPPITKTAGGRRARVRVFCADRVAAPSELGRAPFPRPSA